MSDPSMHVLTELDGDVLRVTLNRPDVRNAQTPQMWERLAAIATSVPEQARFVVLDGKGVDFSAGLDRNVLTDTGPDGMVASLQTDPDAFIRRAQDAFRAWTGIPQVVIAVVQGNVIGAGFQLALASDIMLADPTARFALREASIGLIPDLGGTGALIDALGYRRTFAICATGDFLTAQDATAAGIVHHLSENPHEDLVQLLESLRAFNPAVLGDLKALLRSVASDQDSWTVERETQLNRLQALFGQAQS